MYQIDKNTRDQIIQALQIQIVPAIAGGVIMQIVKLLSELKEVEVPKKDNV